MAAQQSYTIIVKKHPDGYHYVPFDDDPDAHHHHLNMTGHLVHMGHHVEHRHTEGLGKHLVLHSGPMSHLGHAHKG